jgi:hypothetical protein
LRNYAETGLTSERLQLGIENCPANGRNWGGNGRAASFPNTARTAFRRSDAIVSVGNGTGWWLAEDPV